jgi:hypothetical protein
MRYQVQLKRGQAPVQDVALTVRLDKIPAPRIVRVTVPAAPGAGWVSKFNDGDPFWKDSGMNTDHPFLFAVDMWQSTDQLLFGSEGLVPVTTGPHAGWQVGYRPTKARISFRAGGPGGNLVMTYWDGDTTPAVYDGVTVNTRTNEALGLTSDIGALVFHADGVSGTDINITNVEFFEP